jgi:hypothetical protein
VVLARQAGKILHRLDDSPGCDYGFEFGEVRRDLRVVLHGPQYFPPVSS